MPCSVWASAFALASLSLVSASAPPTPATVNDITAPSPFRGSFEVVPQIECAGGRGSGVRISDDIVITAAHVASLGPCGIDGAPVVTAYNQLGRDFSAVRGDFGPGYRAIVSCEGVKAGERYWAYGYANGGKANVEPLLGTNQKGDDGTVMLRGRVYHGMSGGALFTEEGAVVAITVMMHKETDWAYVVPLTETYLCA